MGGELPHKTSFRSSLRRNGGNSCVT